MKEKILELFNRIELEPVKLFYCEKAGNIVDNGCGMEFPLPEYAIVCKKDPLLDTTDEEYSEIAEFEFNNDIDILKFCSEVYRDELLDKLNSDGYTEIWNNEK